MMLEAQIIQLGTFTWEFLKVIVSEKYRIPRFSVGFLPLKDPMKADKFLLPYIEVEIDDL